MTKQAHGRPRHNALPTITELHARFTYEPETGFIWHAAADLFGNHRRADQSLQHGYRIVHLKTSSGWIQIRAHRLAFALKTGHWPHMIDHRNRVRDDNRWSNLRAASPSENRRNTIHENIFRIRRTNTANGYAWRINVMGNRLRTTQRRDFCAAWKIRRQWLAERAAENEKAES